eukprot:4353659-Amphidinium_carterae.1
MDCTSTLLRGSSTRLILHPLCEGGYCRNECAELFDWPPGWTSERNQEHKFNLIETWMFCAICLQR